MNRLHLLTWWQRLEAPMVRVADALDALDRTVMAMVGGSLAGLTLGQPAQHGEDFQRHFAALAGVARVAARRLRKTPPPPAQVRDAAVLGEALTGIVDVCEEVVGTFADAMDHVAQADAAELERAMLRIGTLLDGLSAHLDTFGSVLDRLAAASAPKERC